MLSPNLLKSQSPITLGGGEGGDGVSDDQFPTFYTESKSAKIPKSHYSGGRGGGQWQPISNFLYGVQIC